MGVDVNRETLQNLIDGDIKWLNNMMTMYAPHSIEGRHIITCLECIPYLIFNQDFENKKKNHKYNGKQRKRNKGI